MGQYVRCVKAQNCARSAGEAEDFDNKIFSRGETMTDTEVIDLMGSEILKAVCLEFSGVPYPNKEIMIRGAMAHSAGNTPVLFIPCAIAGGVVGLIFGGSTAVMVVVTVGLVFYFMVYPGLKLMPDQKRWRSEAVDALAAKARELKIDEGPVIDFYKSFSKKLRKNQVELASIVLDEDGMALLKRWQGQKFQEAQEARRALVQGFRDMGSALGNELKNAVQEGWNGK
jgi:hypothetical protein